MIALKFRESGMAEKRGRPSALQLDEQRGEVVWQRLAEQAREFGLDPRLTSQIGRLRVKRLLTDAQAAAADLIGRAYGRYERLHGKRRAARSPSYEFFAPAVRDRYEDPEWVAQVEADWRRLQECMPLLPRDARDVVEQLCVENRAVSALQLNSIVYGVLNEVSVAFDLGPPAEGRSVSAARSKRVSRQEKFERGVYVARHEDATPATSRHHPDGSIAAREHAATVRRIERGNSRRARDTDEALV
jgi:hypothetical protein